MIEEQKLWWVNYENSQKVGPFDTERDAHICCEALNQFVDWQTWKVTCSG